MYWSIRTISGSENSSQQWKRALVKILFRLKAAPVMNALLGQAMKTNMVVDWGIRQAMYILGAKTPYE